MNHYSIAQWADYTRGLGPATETAGMQAHLALGCADCRQTVNFCARLAAICERMAAIEVPEWVLRNAQALCPARRREERRRGARIAMELIYDSFLVPAPAGLRATWQVGWQGMYRAGDCSLDLRVEPELHSSRAALIGQISNHSLPDQRMEGVTVYLKAGRAVVARTRSNLFGEFQMEYEQQARLQLCVDLEGGSKRFQVLLKRITSDKHSGIERRALRMGTDDKLEEADQETNGN